MSHAKLNSSTLLEVLVAITLVITILVMTFTIFLKIYQSSLTLPYLKTFFYKHQILNQTIINRKFISFSQELPIGTLNQEVSDTANGLLKIQIKTDSLSRDNNEIVLLITKD